MRDYPQLSGWSQRLPGALRDARGRLKGNSARFPHVAGSEVKEACPQSLFMKGQGADPLMTSAWGPERRKQGSQPELCPAEPCDNPRVWFSVPTFGVLCWGSKGKFQPWLGAAWGQSAKKVPRPTWRCLRSCNRPLFYWAKLPVSKQLVP